MCHMKVLIPVCLFLPWNKIFFGYLFARILYFGMIDAAARMNWDGGPVKGAVDMVWYGIFRWVWYIPSRFFYFFFIF